MICPDIIDIVQNEHLASKIIGIDMHPKDLSALSQTCKIFHNSPHVSNALSVEKLERMHRDVIVLKNIFKLTFMSRHDANWNEFTDLHWTYLQRHMKQMIHKYHKDIFVMNTIRDIKRNMFYDIFQTNHIFYSSKQKIVKIIAFTICTPLSLALIIPGGILFGYITIMNRVYSLIKGEKFHSDLFDCSHPYLGLD